MTIRRVIERLALAVGALLLLGYVGAAVFLVLAESRLTYPESTRSDPGTFVPGPGTPFPWDSVRIVDADSTPIFLILSHTDAASGVWALYFHGRTMPVGAPANVGRVGFLRDAGFNVIAVEYRGYGASLAAGPPSEEGIHADTRAAWTYLTTSMGVASERILLYGWSFGSAPATRLASEVSAGALVTEGAHTSAPDLAAASYPWLPVRLLMRSRFANVERAGAVRAPWLLLHGRADRAVPPHHAEALRAAGRNMNLIWLDAGHEGGVLEDREAALSALREHTRRLFESRPPVGAPGRDVK